MICIFCKEERTDLMVHTRVKRVSGAIYTRYKCRECQKERVNDWLVRSGKASEYVQKRHLAKLGYSNDRIIAKYASR